MGTIRRLTDLQLGSINTMKVLNVNSAGVTYQISSGNRALEVTNLSGSQTLYYGNAVTVGTGGIISSSGSKFWDTVVDNFTLTFFASSGGVSILLAVQEYAGN